MEKRSRMMPSSAKGAIASGREMVAYSSQGNCCVIAPRPEGPTIIPARMKPMTGLMRKRAKVAGDDDTRRAQDDERIA
jgi:hypothetical protein